MKKKTAKILKYIRHWRPYLKKGESQYGPALTFLIFSTISLICNLIMFTKDHFVHQFEPELTQGLHFLHPFVNWRIFSRVFLFGVPLTNAMIQLFTILLFLLRFKSREMFSAYVAFCMAEYFFAIGCSGYVGINSLKIRIKIQNMKYKRELLFHHFQKEINHNLDLSPPNWVELLQNKFACCGIYEYKDYEKVWNWKSKNDSSENLQIPQSCCIEQSKECGIYNEDTNHSLINKSIHLKGCSSSFYESIELYLLTTTIQGFSLVFVTMLTWLILLNLSLHERHRYILKRRREDEEKEKLAKKGRANKNISKKEKKVKEIRPKKASKKKRKKDNNFYYGSSSSSSSSGSSRGSSDKGTEKSIASKNEDDEDIIDRPRYFE